jgi:hypothetical protein
MLHSITFSIPEEKIINTIPTKTKLVSDLIPGKLSTYIYKNEHEYYNEYKRSLFAITTKKGGWDCMRHYEILANGCVPLFTDIEKCPVNTLALFPKELMLKAHYLYSIFFPKKVEDLTSEEWSDYNSLVTQLLDYTRGYLTTRKLAEYVLEKSKHTNVKNILFLSGYTGPDYLRCLTLHGFKQLYGKHCHDYPKIPHIYKSNTINYSALYGKGISYTNLLESSDHDDSLDSLHSIEDKIKTKSFDLIIYGSYHDHTIHRTFYHGMPLFDLINQIYKPNEIILLCGEDIHSCNYSSLISKGYTVFVREL